MLHTKNHPAVSTERVPAESNGRWVLWVDIEGFKHLFKHHDGERAIRRLAGLMSDVCEIGRKYFYPDNGQLRAHQFGDGFMVSPDLGDEKLDIVISLTVALMKATAFREGFLSATVTWGEFGDRVGCYPACVRENRCNGTVLFGQAGEGGLMTINPVLGEGFVRAYELSSLQHGPQLVVDERLAGKLNDQRVRQKVRKGCISVDWIRYNSRASQEMLQKTMTPHEFQTLSDRLLIDKLRNYLSYNKGLPCNWKRSAKELIRGY